MQVYKKKTTELSSDLNNTILNNINGNVSLLFNDMDNKKYIDRIIYLQNNSSKYRLSIEFSWNRGSDSPSIITSSGYYCGIYIVDISTIKYSKLILLGMTNYFVGYVDGSDSSLHMVWKQLSTVSA